MAMSVSIKDDPFTRVLAALWDLVEDHYPLTQMIAVGNRIYRQDQPHAERSRIQDGDAPELNILPVGFTSVDELYSSDTASFRQQFEFHLTTGSRDETELLFPITWELLRALAASKKTKLNLAYVRNMEIDGVDHSRTDSADQRGRLGWTCVLTVTVILIFDWNRHLLATDPVLE